MKTSCGRELLCFGFADMQQQVHLNMMVATRSCSLTKHASATCWDRADLTCICPEDTFIQQLSAQRKEFRRHSGGTDVIPGMFVSKNLASSLQVVSESTQQQQDIM